MAKNNAGSNDREKLTKSKERVRQYGEVYTPEHIVKQMCDLMPDDTWDLEHTILEPTCGNGNFLVEIFARKLEHCKTADDGVRALRTIYAIDILPDNVIESRDRLYEMFVNRFGASAEAIVVLREQVICGDSLKIMKELETSDWATTISQQVIS